MTCEELQKAEQGASMLCDNLRQANKGATAIESLVILDCLQAAVALQQKLAAVVSALGGTD